MILTRPRYALVRAIFTSISIRLAPVARRHLGQTSRCCLRAEESVSGWRFWVASNGRCPVAACWAFPSDVFWSAGEIAVVVVVS